VSRLSSLVADAILILHFGFIAFVVGGEVCVVVGYFRNWRWVRNLAFRICHALAIGVVVGQAWLEQICPLTDWENALRNAAGEDPYSGTFVQHWIGRMVYYDAPAWVFTLVYSLFGALVLFSWIWVKPGKGIPKEAV
jgi:hypothetical protein